MTAKRGCERCDRLATALREARAEIRANLVYAVGDQMVCRCRTCTGRWPRGGKEEHTYPCPLYDPDNLLTDTPEPLVVTDIDEEPPDGNWQRVECSSEPKPDDTVGEYLFPLPPGCTGVRVRMVDGAVLMHNGLPVMVAEGTDTSEPKECEGCVSLSTTIRCALNHLRCIPDVAHAFAAAEHLRGARTSHEERKPEPPHTWQQERASVIRYCELGACVNVIIGAMRRWDEEMGHGIRRDMIERYITPALVTAFSSGAHVNEVLRVDGTKGTSGQEKISLMEEALTRIEQAADRARITSGTWDNVYRLAHAARIGLPLPPVWEHYGDAGNTTPEPKGKGANI